MQFKVGTAGLPAGSKGSLDAIEKVKSLGLDAMEIEFVRGVYLTNSAAETVGKKAKELGIALTVHAPYYVNLNSKDNETIEASKKRIWDSAERGEKAGVRSVTFHAGYRHEKDETAAYDFFKRQILDVVRKCPKVRLAPEATGKFSQFGTWEELLKMHKDTDCGVCFDFAHIWARELGEIDFNEVLNKIKKEYSWWKDMHVHLSGIRFGAKGELNHLMLDDTKLPWKKILSLLVEKGFGGVIICESPNPTKDALLIKNYLSGL